MFEDRGRSALCLIRAIVLAVIVSVSLLGSASVANANSGAAGAVIALDSTTFEQLDPGDPGFPPDQ